MTSEARCLLKILWENSGNEHFSLSYSVFQSVTVKKKKQKISPHVNCHTAKAFGRDNYAAIILPFQLMSPTECT